MIDFGDIFHSLLENLAANLSMIQPIGLSPLLCWISRTLQTTSKLDKIYETTIYRHWTIGSTKL